MGAPPVGAGRSRAHPANERGRPTRTPTARIVLNNPCPAGGGAGRSVLSEGLALRNERGVDVVTCWLCAGSGVVLRCGRCPSEPGPPGSLWLTAPVWTPVGDPAR